DAERRWLSRFVEGIRWVAEACDDQRSNLLSFHLIRLPAAVSEATHPVGNQCWPHRGGHWLAQRTNGQVVGEVVAELYDFRDATKMLAQGDNAAECCFSEVVYRCLAVVKVAVRNAL